MEDKDQEDKRNSLARETSLRDSYSSASERSSKVADKYEPINVEGQDRTGIWVHHPGSEVSQTWEPRKGKGRQLDTQITGESNGPFKRLNSLAAGSFQNDSNSSDESSEGKKGQTLNTVKRGLEKIGSVFHRNKKEDHSSHSGDVIPSPPSNIREANSKGIGVRFIVDDSLSCAPAVPKENRSSGDEGSGPESPNKGNVKDKAKSFLKQAGKSARGLKQALSRKGSRKSPGDPDSIARETPGFDSSDEESVSSPVCTPTTKTIPIISTPIPRNGNDPVDHKEQVVLIGATAASIEEPVREMKEEDTTAEKGL